MKEEDGVAAVVALMLILAVIVTFLSLYATTYLPALKQQAEIAQVSEVKEAFMRFDSDLEHILSEKTNLTYGEMVPLGGGDILLNPSKSSGTIWVGMPEELYTLSYNSGTGTETYTGSMVNVTYEPSFSYWESQGYSWQYGYINVTKGSGKRATPLSFRTRADAESRVQEYGGKFLSVTPVENSSAPGYLRELVVTAVSVDRIPEETEISGSGAGTLRAESGVSESSWQTNELTITVVESTPFAGSLASRVNGLNGVGNVTVTTPSAGQYILTFKDTNLYPVNLTLRKVKVTVSVR